MFNGIVSGLGDLILSSDAESRSVCPENPTGERGGGAKATPQNGSAGHASELLGEGWKCNPYVKVGGGETFVAADIEGEGTIDHFWITPTGKWRDTIIRIYYDGSESPSVECPIGDFFCMGWGKYAQISSLAVCVNPGSALNCYWKMPFKKRFRMTLTNLAETEVTYYYQLDYTLTKLPENCLYFHAQFRRVNPLPYKSVYTILDGVKGRGHYVGTYLAWGVNNNGWWGEGEIKFYIDGDKKYPTICGTGTEDYFCGSYNFEDPETHDRYRTFTTPYSGLAQVIEPDKLYRSQFRFGLYRWHINDPVRFRSDLKVTIQALGWRGGKHYLPLQDDISSVAFWYQTLPAAAFPALPDRETLEII